jgi:LysM repeat protein
MFDDRSDPDAARELPDEFWGGQTEWTPQRPPSPARRSAGSAIATWWSTFLGGSENAPRRHGAASTRTHAHETRTHPHNPDHAELERQEFDEHGGEWMLQTPEPTPRAGGVDPLIARLGALAVIVTLAAPLVVGFTSSGSETSAGSPDSIGIVAPIDPDVNAPNETSTATPSADTSSVPAPTASSTASTVGATAGESVDEPTTTASTSGVEATAAADALDGAAALTQPAGSVSAESSPASTEPTATTPPATTSPPCGDRYELAAGDYWIRIADAAGVPLAQLLDVNDATVDTVLVPGRSICLPVGASTPAPPAPPTTTPRATTTTTAPSRTPTTTSPPRTPTAPPTTSPATTVPSRPAAVPESQAVQIIRDVWPDELEERAIEIAWRESNHRSNVNNWCCYGLFQIHWQAHRSWLGSVGITSISGLYDPVLNTRAAYALYQRAGGFGPWGG